MGGTGPDTVIDLEQRRLRAVGGGTGGGTDRLLHRIATMLNSTLELRVVLRQLAEIALEASRADRSSLFLLDGHELRPAVAIGTVADEDLWAAFQAMGPVDVRDVPGAFDHLRSGCAVAVEDARDTDMIPTAWADRFGIGAAVLVPLLALDEPCGVLAVDYAEPRPFDADLLELLEAVGAAAGVAVRNARIYEATQRRARVNEALARGAGALVAGTAAAEVAGVLVEAYSDLLSTRLCLIGLFDHRTERITTLAARGGHQHDAPIPFSRVPDRIVDRLVGSWQESLRPVRFDADPWFAEIAGTDPTGISEHLVLPIAVGERVRGGVVLGFDRRTRLEPEERQAARALAAFAAAALERASLHERLERNVRRLEVLHEVSAALVEGARAATLVDRLNHVLSAHGIEVVGMALRDRELARHLGGGRPTREERAVLRDGRAAATADGILAVPMRLGKRAVGVLRVRAGDLDPDDRSFVEAVATGVAEVAGRGALRSALDEVARERVVTAERERMAADLHDSVGQLLIGMGLLADRWRDELPADSPWAARLGRFVQLADGGQWEIDQAVRALTFVPARGELAGALRELARSFEQDSGIQVVLDVRGRTTGLAVNVERALYRITHGALSNAWRHARCAVVRVELDATGEPLALRVRDDGIGLGGRSGDSVPGLGIASMRRSIDEAGGRLRVTNASPRGALVEAHLPRDGGR